MSNQKTQRDVKSVMLSKPKPSQNNIGYHVNRNSKSSGKPPLRSKAVIYLFRWFAICDISLPNGAPGQRVISPCSLMKSFSAIGQPRSSSPTGALILTGNLRALVLSWKGEVKDVHINQLRALRCGADVSPEVSDLMSDIVRTSSQKTGHWVAAGT